jgi:aarF domain-containing kinase
VAFLDFGIVGRVSPGAWGALNALLRAASGGDWRAAAAALAALGAADEAVDVDAFGADLAALAASLASVRATVVLDPAGGAGPGAPPAATLAVDEADVNRIILDVVRVGDAHGVKFPREFGLLLKSLLYLDRYTRALAPGLDVVNDARVNMGAPGAGGRISYG